MHLSVSKRRIALFDSLTHPTISGEWWSTRKRSNSFQALLKEMRKNEVSRAFAVGIPGVGGYDAREYARRALKSGERLLPVAELTRDDLRKGSSHLRRLREFGFVGVKVHPRRLRLSGVDREVVRVVCQAVDIGLVPFICTYSHGGMIPGHGWGVEVVAELLNKTHGSPLVLLHGGGVRLLEMTELVRLYPAVVMDLSFTLCKYEGSSVDKDLAFVFNSFDERICVGSDSPDFNLSRLRKRFDEFGANVPPGKASAIGSGNIERILAEVQ